MKTEWQMSKKKIFKKKQRKEEAVQKVGYKKIKEK